MLCCATGEYYLNLIIVIRLYGLANVKFIVGIYLDIFFVRKP